jgi:hypothetical protein
MKSTRVFLWLGCLFILALMTACPVSTSYPLITAGKSVVDNALIGTWKNDSTDAEANKIKITKASDSTYWVYILEKGTMFMADADTFIAWQGHLGDHDYLVLREYIIAPQETYYVYSLKKQKDKMVTNDITLKVNGTDAIVSILEYQKEVLASEKISGFLASEITWSKVE